LTLLDQKADRVQIKGCASRWESIPDFMSNLSQSGYFRSVDLELIEVDQTGARFSLVCIPTSRVPTE
jgi:Tfp pilus assembly protein PilN